MKKKRISSILAILILGITIVGCGKRGESPISFHLAHEKPQPNCIEMTTVDGERTLFLEKTPQLTIDDIAYAEFKSFELTEESKKQMEKYGLHSSTHDYLSIRFTAEGKKKFFKVTSENVYKHLGMIIDGKLLMVPVIREAVNANETQITGDFKKEELEAIANRINELVNMRKK